MSLPDTQLDSQRGPSSQPGKDSEGGGGRQTQGEQEASAPQAVSARLAERGFLWDRSCLRPVPGPIPVPGPVRQRREAGHWTSAFVSERKNVSLTYLSPSYCLSSFKMTSRKAIMKFTWGVWAAGGGGGSWLLTASHAGKPVGFN